MDRPIDTHVLQRMRRHKLLQVSLLLGGILALFFLLSAWIRPSIDRKDIQTALVQRGAIEGTISASGSVVPKFEQAISSPGETRLLAMRKKPGEYVKKGDPLLDLDRSEFTLALERTERELSLKANRQIQLKLDINRTLNDLRGQLDIKDLRLQYLHSKSEQGDKMFTLGAIAKDQLEQTKLEERIASIEKKELEQSIQTTKQSLGNQLEGITTEVRTLLQEKDDFRRQLDLLSCKAEQNGVVTWVKDQIGASIHRGEIIARVADLSSYRVEATVSDIHASRLSIGMSAKIRLNDLTISGKIETVYPTIENGIAKVALVLDDASNKFLRPSLRVDVFLITNRHENTLKVKKGQFVNGEGQQEVFVIRGNTAQQVTVKVGVMSFDEIEIAEGLSEGEEIIISNMNEYKHLSQIKIH
ncbi:MAG: efflux RND transporter periplasmic adaptor subunit [Ignavibacteria bacterium]|nr:efflux RND transporter periplasmic adaptor subunit [Ignavibacteria bacterium]